MLAVLAVLLISAIVGLAVRFSRERANRDDNDDAEAAITLVPSISSVPSASPAVTPVPTLSSILDRDAVRCCVNEGYTIGKFETELVRKKSSLCLFLVPTYDTLPHGIHSCFLYSAEGSQLLF
jgi:hypothetical protein